MFLTWFALCTVGEVHAQTQTPGRDQLVKFAQGLDTLEARFNQRVLAADGAVQDESEGQVWLHQPRHFRWEYGGEFPELVVADGTNLWIYDESLEQVTVKPQSDFAADSPLSLLSDIGSLDKQFEVREAGDLDGMALLDLRAISKESEFGHVVLGLQGDELKLMAMEDSFGMRTEIHFTAINRNLPLEASLFTFDMPEGADLIGDLPNE